ncbi:OLC1v1030141C1 [Oldenlandia corymbosa var. corymbosa]|uniref:OLC1v1030141C1 n=1 Tax=Oldenlandia corymbosa var. corymbosa TaxID=529605 RepID=A0AAV1CFF2_OLDCO|nr:OLC1v1030141C1 [Oldenlandia corymbosa var. corymbosa]
MAQILQNCALIFIVALTITSFLPFGSSDLIETTCQKTPNVQLCDNILRNDPKSSSANLDGLTLIIINSLASKSNYTLKMIDQMLKDRPELKSPLTECWNHYNVISTFFILDAIEAANNGDVRLGEESMYEVKDFAGQCDDEFKPNPSPFVNVHQMVSDIADVTSSMFTMMSM